MYEQNKLPVSLLVTTTTTFHMKCVYLFSSGFQNRLVQKPNVFITLFVIGRRTEMKSEHGRKGDKKCYSLFQSRKLFN